MKKKQTSKNFVKALGIAFAILSQSFASSKALISNQFVDHHSNQENWKQSLTRSEDVAPINLLERFHNVQIANRFLYALQADHIITDTKAGVFITVTNEQLSALTNLDLSNLGLNNIDFLHTSGLTFSKLQTLNLANNNFSSTKLSFEAKIFPSLYELDLSHTQLKTFPNLETYGVSSNQLRILNLSHNQLSNWPVYLSKLKLGVLDLSFNSLTNTAILFGESQNLTPINMVAWNNQKDINGLFDTNKLKAPILDLSFNQLSSFPKINVQGKFGVVSNFSNQAIIKDYYFDFAGFANYFGLDASRLDSVASLAKVDLFKQALIKSGLNQTLVSTKSAINLGKKFSITLNRNYEFAKIHVFNQITPDFLTAKSLKDPQFKLQKLVSNTPNSIKQVIQLNPSMLWYGRNQFSRLLLNNLAVNQVQVNVDGLQGLLDANLTYSVYTKDRWQTYKLNAQLKGLNTYSLRFKNEQSKKFEALDLTKKKNEPILLHAPNSLVQILNRFGLNMVSTSLISSYFQTNFFSFKEFKNLPASALKIDAIDETNGKIYFSLNNDENKAFSSELANKSFVFIGLVRPHIGVVGSTTNPNVISASLNVNQISSDKRALFEKIISSSPSEITATQIFELGAITSNRSDWLKVNATNVVNFISLHANDAANELNWTLNLPGDLSRNLAPMRIDVTWNNVGSKTDVKTTNTKKIIDRQSAVTSESTFVVLPEVSRTDEASSDLNLIVSNAAGESTPSQIAIQKALNTKLQQLTIVSNPSSGASHTFVTNLVASLKQIKSIIFPSTGIDFKVKSAKLTEGKSTFGKVLNVEFVNWSQTAIANFFSYLALNHSLSTLTGEVDPIASQWAFQIQTAIKNYVEANSTTINWNDVSSINFGAEVVNMADLTPSLTLLTGYETADTSTWNNISTTKFYDLSSSPKKFKPLIDDPIYWSLLYNLGKYRTKAITNANNTNFGFVAQADDTFIRNYLQIEKAKVGTVNNVAPIVEILSVEPNSDFETLNINVRLKWVSNGQVYYSNAKTFALNDFKLQAEDVNAATASWSVNATGANTLIENITVGNFENYVNPAVFKAVSTNLKAVIKSVGVEGNSLKITYQIETIPPAGSTIKKVFANSIKTAVIDGFATPGSLEQTALEKQLNNVSLVKNLTYSDYASTGLKDLGSPTLQSWFDDRFQSNFSIDTARSRVQLKQVSGSSDAYDLVINFTNWTDDDVTALFAYLSQSSVDSNIKSKWAERLQSLVQNYLKINSVDSSKINSVSFGVFAPVNNAMANQLQTIGGFATSVVSKSFNGVQASQFVDTTSNLLKLDNNGLKNGILFTIGKNSSKANLSALVNYSFQTIISPDNTKLKALFGNTKKALFSAFNNEFTDSIWTWTSVSYSDNVGKVYLTGKLQSTKLNLTSTFIVKTFEINGFLTFDEDAKVAVPIFNLKSPETVADIDPSSINQINYTNYVEQKGNVLATYKNGTTIKITSVTGDSITGALVIGYQLSFGSIFSTNLTTIVAGFKSNFLEESNRLTDLLNNKVTAIVKAGSQNKYASSLLEQPLYTPSDNAKLFENLEFTGLNPTSDNAKVVITNFTYNDELGTATLTFHLESTKAGYQNFRSSDNVQVISFMSYQKDLNNSTSVKWSLLEETKVFPSEVTTENWQNYLKVDFDQPLNATRIVKVTEVKQTGLGEITLFYHQSLTIGDKTFISFALETARVTGLLVADDEVNRTTYTFIPKKNQADTLATSLTKNNFDEILDAIAHDSNQNNTYYEIMSLSTNPDTGIVTIKYRVWNEGAVGNELSTFVQLATPSTKEVARLRGLASFLGATFNDASQNLASESVVGSISPQSKTFTKSNSAFVISDEVSSLNLIKFFTAEQILNNLNTIAITFSNYTVAELKGLFAYLATNPEDKELWLNSLASSVYQFLKSKANFANSLPTDPITTDTFFQSIHKIIFLGNDQLGEGTASEKLRELKKLIKNGFNEGLTLGFNPATATQKPLVVDGFNIVSSGLVTNKKKNFADGDASADYRLKLSPTNAQAGVSILLKYFLDLNNKNGIYPPIYENAFYNLADKNLMNPDSVEFKALVAKLNSKLIWVNDINGSTNKANKKIVGLNYDNTKGVLYLKVELVSTTDPTSKFKRWIPVQGAPQSDSIQPTPFKTIRDIVNSSETIFAYSGKEEQNSFDATKINEINWSEFLTASFKLKNNVALPLSNDNFRLRVRRIVPNQAKGVIRIFYTFSVLDDNVLVSSSVRVAEVKGFSTNALAVETARLNQLLNDLSIQPKDSNELASSLIPAGAIQSSMQIGWPTEIQQLQINSIPIISPAYNLDQHDIILRSTNWTTNELASLISYAALNGANRGIVNKILIQQITNALVQIKTGQKINRIYLVGLDATLINFGPHFMGENLNVNDRLIFNNTQSLETLGFLASSYQALTQQQLISPSEFAIFDSPSQRWLLKNQTRIVVGQLLSFLEGQIFLTNKDWNLTSQIFVGDLQSDSSVFANGYSYENLGDGSTIFKKLLITGNPSDDTDQTLRVNKIFVDDQNGQLMISLSYASKKIGMTDVQSRSQVFVVNNFLTNADILRSASVTWTATDAASTTYAKDVNLQNYLNTLKMTIVAPSAQTAKVNVLQVNPNPDNATVTVTYTLSVQSKNGITFTSGARATTIGGFLNLSKNLENASVTWTVNDVGRKIFPQMVTVNNLSVYTEKLILNGGKITDDFDSEVINLQANVREGLLVVSYYLVDKKTKVRSKLKRDVVIGFKSAESYANDPKSSSVQFNLTDYAKTQLATSLTSASFTSFVAIKGLAPGWQIKFVSVDANATKGTAAVKYQLYNPFWNITTNNPFLVQLNGFITPSQLNEGLSVTINLQAVAKFQLASNLDSDNASIFLKVDFNRYNSLQAYSLHFTSFAPNDTDGSLTINYNIMADGQTIATDKSITLNGFLTTQQDLNNTAVVWSNFQKVLPSTITVENAISILGSPTYKNSQSLPNSLNIKVTKLELPNDIAGSLLVNYELIKSGTKSVVKKALLLNLLQINFQQTEVLKATDVAFVQTSKSSSALKASQVQLSGTSTENAFSSIITIGKVPEGLTLKVEALSPDDINGVLNIIYTLTARDSQAITKVATVSGFSSKISAEVQRLNLKLATVSVTKNPAYNGYASALLTNNTTYLQLNDETRVLHALTFNGVNDESGPSGGETAIQSQHVRILNASFDNDKGDLIITFQLVSNNDSTITSNTKELTVNGFLTYQNDINNARATWITNPTAISKLASTIKTLTDLQASATIHFNNYLNVALPTITISGLTPDDDAGKISFKYVLSLTVNKQTYTGSQQSFSFPAKSWLSSLLDLDNATVSFNVSKTAQTTSPNDLTTANIASFIDSLTFNNLQQSSNGISVEYLVVKPDVENGKAQVLYVLSKMINGEKKEASVKVAEISNFATTKETIDQLKVFFSLTDFARVSLPSDFLKASILKLPEYLTLHVDTGELNPTESDQKKADQALTTIFVDSLNFNGAETDDSTGKITFKYSIRGVNGKAFESPERTVTLTGFANTDLATLNETLNWSLKPTQSQAILPANITLTNWSTYLQTNQLPAGVDVIVESLTPNNSSGTLRLIYHLVNKNNAQIVGRSQATTINGFLTSAADLQNVRVSWNGGALKNSSLASSINSTNLNSLLGTMSFFQNSLPASNYRIVFKGFSADDDRGVLTVKYQVVNSSDTTSVSSYTVTESGVSSSAATEVNVHQFILAGFLTKKFDDQHFQGIGVNFMVQDSAKSLLPSQVVLNSVTPTADQKKFDNAISIIKTNAGGVTLTITHLAADDFSGSLAVVYQLSKNGKNGSYSTTIRGLNDLATATKQKFDADNAKLQATALDKTQFASEFVYSNPTNPLSSQQQVTILNALSLQNLPKNSMLEIVSSSADNASGKLSLQVKIRSTDPRLNKIESTQFNLEATGFLTYTKFLENSVVNFNVDGNALTNLASQFVKNAKSDDLSLSIPLPIGAKLNPLNVSNYGTADDATGTITNLAYELSINVGGKQYKANKKINLYGFLSKSVWLDNNIEAKFTLKKGAQTVLAAAVTKANFSNYVEETFSSGTSSLPSGINTTIQAVFGENTTGQLYVIYNQVETTSESKILSSNKLAIISGFGSYASQLKTLSATFAVNNPTKSGDTKDDVVLIGAINANNWASYLVTSGLDNNLYQVVNVSLVNADYAKNTLTLSYQIETKVGPKILSESKTVTISSGFSDPKKFLDGLSAQMTLKPDYQGLLTAQNVNKSNWGAYLTLLNQEILDSQSVQVQIEGVTLPTSAGDSVTFSYRLMQGSVLSDTKTITVGGFSDAKTDLNRIRVNWTAYSSALQTLTSDVTKENLNNFADFSFTNTLTPSTKLNVEIEAVKVTSEIAGAVTITYKVKTKGTAIEAVKTADFSRTFVLVGFQTPTIKAINTLNQTNLTFSLQTIAKTVLASSIVGDKSDFGSDSSAKELKVLVAGLPSGYSYTILSLNSNDIQGSLEIVYLLTKNSTTLGVVKSITITGFAKSNDNEIKRLDTGLKDLNVKLVASDSFYGREIFKKTISGFDSTTSTHVFFGPTAMNQLAIDTTQSGFKRFNESGISDRTKDVSTAHIFFQKWTKTDFQNLLSFIQNNWNSTDATLKNSAKAWLDKVAKVVENYLKTNPNFTTSSGGLGAITAGINSYFGVSFYSQPDFQATGNLSQWNVLGGFTLTNGGTDAFNSKTAADIVSASNKLIITSANSIENAILYSIGKHKSDLFSNSLQNSGIWYEIPSDQTAQANFQSYLQINNLPVQSQLQVLYAQYLPFSNQMRIIGRLISLKTGQQNLNKIELEAIPTTSDLSTNHAKVFILSNAFADAKFGMTSSYQTALNNVDLTWTLKPTAGQSYGSEISDSAKMKEVIDFTVGQLNLMDATGAKLFTTDPAVSVEFISKTANDVNGSLELKVELKTTIDGLSFKSSLRNVIIPKGFLTYNQDLANATISYKAKSSYDVTKNFAASITTTNFLMNFEKDDTKSVDAKKTEAKVVIDGMIINSFTGDLQVVYHLNLTVNTFIYNSPIKYTIIKGFINSTSQHNQKLEFSVNASAKANKVFASTINKNNWPSWINLKTPLSTGSSFVDFNVIANDDATGSLTLSYRIQAFDGSLGPLFQIQIEGFLSVVDALNGLTGAFDLRPSLFRQVLISSLNISNESNFLTPVRILIPAEQQYQTWYNQVNVEITKIQTSGTKADGSAIDDGEAEITYVLSYTYNGILFSSKPKTQVVKNFLKITDLLNKASASWSLIDPVEAANVFSTTQTSFPLRAISPVTTAVSNNENLFKKYVRQNTVISSILNNGIEIEVKGRSGNNDTGVLTINYVLKKDGVSSEEKSFKLSGFINNFTKGLIILKKAAESVQFMQKDAYKLTQLDIRNNLPSFVIPPAAAAKDPRFAFNQLFDRTTNIPGGGRLEITNLEADDVSGTLYIHYNIIYKPRDATQTITYRAVYRLTGFQKGIIYEKRRLRNAIPFLEVSKKAPASNIFASVAVPSLLKDSTDIPKQFIPPVDFANFDVNDDNYNMWFKLPVGGDTDSTKKPTIQAGVIFKNLSEQDWKLFLSFIAQNLDSTDNVLKRIANNWLNKIADTLASFWLDKVRNFTRDVDRYEVLYFYSWFKVALTPSYWNWIGKNSDDGVSYNGVKWSDFMQVINAKKYGHQFNAFKTNDITDRAFFQNQLTSDFKNAFKWTLGKYKNQTIKNANNPFFIAFQNDKLTFLDNASVNANLQPYVPINDVKLQALKAGADDDAGTLTISLTYESTKTNYEGLTVFDPKTGDGERAFVVSKFLTNQQFIDELKLTNIYLERTQLATNLDETTVKKALADATKVAYSSDMASYRTINIQMVDNSLKANAGQGTITFKYRLSFEYGSGADKKTFTSPSELTFTLGGFIKLQDVVNDAFVGFKIKPDQVAIATKTLPSSLTNQKLKSFLDIPEQTDYVTQLGKNTKGIVFDYELESFTYDDNSGNLTISYRIKATNVAHENDQKSSFFVKTAILGGFSTAQAAIEDIIPVISLSKTGALTLPSEITASITDTQKIYWGSVFNVANLNQGFEIIPRFEMANDQIGTITMSYFIQRIGNAHIRSLEKSQTFSGLLTANKVFDNFALTFGIKNNSPIYADAVSDANFREVIDIFGLTFGYQLSSLAIQSYNLNQGTINLQYSTSRAGQTSSLLNAIITGFAKLDTTIPITNTSIFTGTNATNTWTVKSNTFLASQVPSSISASQLLSAGMLLSPAVISHYEITSENIGKMVKLEPNDQTGTLVATVTITPKSNAKPFVQTFVIKNLVGTNDSLDLSAQSYEMLNTIDKQNINYVLSNDQGLINLLDRLSFVIVNTNKTQVRTIIPQTSQLMVGVVHRLVEQASSLVQSTPQGQKLNNNHYLVNNYIYDLNLIKINNGIITFEKGAISYKITNASATNIKNATPIRLNLQVNKITLGNGPDFKLTVGLSTAIALAIFITALTIYYIGYSRGKFPSLIRILIRKKF